MLPGPWWRSSQTLIAILPSKKSPQFYPCTSASTPREGQKKSGKERAGHQAAEHQDLFADCSCRNHARLDPSCNRQGEAGASIFLDLGKFFFQSQGRPGVRLTIHGTSKNRSVRTAHDLLRRGFPWWTSSECRRKQGPCHKEGRRNKCTTGTQTGTYSIVSVGMNQYIWGSAGQAGAATFILPPRIISPATPGATWA